MRTTAVRRLFREGRPLPGRRMVMFVAPGTGDVAFVAGRKIGGAVERNRAKRLLRAALREAAPDGVVNRDVVLVAREGIRGVGSRDLIEEMGELLEQAGARS